jgi:hypothetical protein
MCPSSFNIKYMAIKKNDFSSIKKKFSKEAEYKPDRFLDLGDAFLDATGIPGPAVGHINMFLGHSDTGWLKRQLMHKRKVFFLFSSLQNKNGIGTMRY